MIVVLGHCYDILQLMFHRSSTIVVHLDVCVDSLNSEQPAGCSTARRRMWEPCLAAGLVMDLVRPRFFASVAVGGKLSQQWVDVDCGRRQQHWVHGCSGSHPGRWRQWGGTEWKCMVGMARRTETLVVAVLGCRQADSLLAQHAWVGAVCQLIRRMCEGGTMGMLGLVTILGYAKFRISLDRV